MLQATIRCPKCSHELVSLSEMYYCTFPTCCEAFSLDELIHEWGFDAADFYGKVTATNFPEPIADIHFDYVSFEPLWMNESERIHSYEFVREMLNGVNYVDDYTDLLQTQEYAK